MTALYMIVFYVVRYIQDEFYEVGELYFLNSLSSRVTNFKRRHKFTFIEPVVLVISVLVYVNGPSLEKINAHYVFFYK